MEKNLLKNVEGKLLMKKKKKKNLINVVKNLLQNVVEWNRMNMKKKMKTTALL